MSFVNLPYKWILSISCWCIIRLNSESVFPDPEPPFISNLCGWSGIFGQFGLCSFMYYFVTSLKSIIFVLLYYIVTFDLVFFTHYILLVPYVYVSIKLIDCICWSSFELKVILLISSVKTLCPFLLNLFCTFDVTLLYFYEFFMIFSRITHIKVFLNGLFCFQFELIRNNVYILQI